MIEQTQPVSSARTSPKTPLMKQFCEVKNAHPDKIVLFRMGDFYEMFHEDAITAAPILGIALTKRNPKDETPMCGVPHHSAEGPINKLLKAGYKVAMCEQLEDPALAKGLVKRGVTRILTPGMVYDPDSIPQDRGNYICAIAETEIAFADPSTGEAFYYEVDTPKFWGLIQILKPVEFVMNEEWRSTNDKTADLLGKMGVITTRNIIASSACETLKNYIREAQGGMEPEFQRRELLERFCLSSLSLRHLEIFETYHGHRTGSLIHAIDRTKTSLGSRQLRRWLSFPETNIKVISARLDQVQSWIDRSDLMKIIREKLSRVGDMERRLGRLYLSNSNARDLLALAQSLAITREVLQLSDPSVITSQGESLFQGVQRIQDTLREDLPLAVRDGGLIKRGVKLELDELLDLTSDHSTLLQQIELREKESTGISSLKVKYNAIFGYFIEVTHTHKDKVPKHYIRKQTLSTAERFTTDELIHLEEKILSAKSRRNDFEFEIFSQLREDIKKHSSEILRLSHWVGELDTYLAFAWLSLEQNYVRPTIDTSDSPRVTLLSSRHPVLEQMQAQKNFVANDLIFARGESILLTGPNMAGKSTLMRQVAISALLMQVGCFVPAREANLPVFDRILTRIGSSDNLSEGLSTFMVEMTETAELVENSTKNSLVILDEIGRGTATFDGMSLAQAILEYLHKSKRATIMFATHYHELAALEEELPGLHNYHMSIREKLGADVQFTYQLTKGAAGKSYGIQVATLAGLPKAVTNRAAQILNSLETPEKLSQKQMTLFDQLQKTEESHPLREEILGLDLNNLTPLSALLKISEWHQKLSSDKIN